MALRIHISVILLLSLTTPEASYAASLSVKEGGKGPLIDHVAKAVNAFSFPLDDEGSSYDPDKELSLFPKIECKSCLATDETTTPVPPDTSAKLVKIEEPGEDDEEEEEDFGVDDGLKSRLEGPGATHMTIDASEGGYSYPTKVPKHSLTEAVGKTKEDFSSSEEDTLKQVIFIEPPEYVYKHDIKVKPDGTTGEVQMTPSKAAASVLKPKRKRARTIIYVFPPMVKHIYNITHSQQMKQMLEDNKPQVYYLGTSKSSQFHHPSRDEVVKVVGESQKEMLGLEINNKEDPTEDSNLYLPPVQDNGHAYNISNVPSLTPPVGEGRSTLFRNSDVDSEGSGSSVAQETRNLVREPVYHRVTTTTPVPITTITTPNTTTTRQHHHIVKKRIITRVRASRLSPNNTLLNLTREQKRRIISAVSNSPTNRSFKTYITTPTPQQQNTRVPIPPMFESTKIRNNNKHFLPAGHHLSTATTFKPNYSPKQGNVFPSQMSVPLLPSKGSLFPSTTVIKPSYFQPHHHQLKSTFPPAFPTPDPITITTYAPTSENSVFSDLNDLGYDVKLKSYNQQENYNYQKEYSNTEPKKVYRRFNYYSPQVFDKLMAAGLVNNAEVTTSTPATSVFFTTSKSEESLSQSMDDFRLQKAQTFNPSQFEKYITSPNSENFVPPQSNGNNGGGEEEDWVWNEKPLNLEAFTPAPPQKQGDQLVPIMTSAASSHRIYRTIDYGPRYIYHPEEDDNNGPMTTSIKLRDERDTSNVKSFTIWETPYRLQ